MLERGLHQGIDLYRCPDEDRRTLGGDVPGPNLSLLARVLQHHI
jgi:hypothetical protein